ncbi:hypothetical protein EMIHUDRAFT_442241 [Emiliania huxleyi CCMP1516]|jgi:hypothetical protein|uniref:Uncharacterized protein n=2 Tax=Emiliania huxleyi TaxID=2903 RepID=A0A0D3K6H5_EMIH1|nr:hypothetical protein EMIHUDRAFT_442241 [Emiliania huxleyi CCMP1516]EOD31360.1 hypothetical protein EMIHUDRAFT_442241 [Emiliania huxleyi CCMP1516]|eukprot:XP_005783789.1 hypothetical protein EMIHUDRAFT_442241 [Emiliania huxleyi CCMP1516]
MMVLAIALLSAWPVPTPRTSTRRLFALPPAARHSSVLLEASEASCATAASAMTKVARPKPLPLDLAAISFLGAFLVNRLLAASPRLVGGGACALKVTFQIGGAVLLPVARLRLAEQRHSGMALQITDTAGEPPVPAARTRRASAAHTLQGASLCLERKLVEMELEQAERRKIADERLDAAEAARAALHSAQRWAKAAEAAEAAGGADGGSGEAVAALHAAAAQLVRLEAAIADDELTAAEMLARVDTLRAQSIEARVSARAARPGLFARSGREQLPLTLAAVASLDAVSAEGMERSARARRGEALLEGGSVAAPAAASGGGKEEGER